ncbi:hypothetical protein ABZL51_001619 [Campylobacter jejuni]|uniref:Uncharacterized protein n=1 Tax=Campylobacter jejuni TaxID=197 RepID=A0A430YVY7_CAMJU|nr:MULTISPECIES: hypothetical protein [Campylobacter]EAK3496109.1 hypothetical protein [Campylobacter jejuni]EAL1140858.1 hypothetical protein [Campylobacter jejuni]ECL3018562.1 hypothetical protein [Campylobacter jejuni]ECL6143833.1 hypothetical protein [Campylobacter jejuni]ECO2639565.1 hypothetical protein [Campylobacter jejuni]
MKTIKLLLKIFFVLSVFFIVLIGWAYFELKDNFTAFEQIQKNVMAMNNTEMVEKYNTTDKEKVIRYLILDYLEKNKK